MVFHWSLSDSKSPQVFRTLLSILADLNNPVVKIVPIRPLISKSSSPSTNPLVTVPRAPITVAITTTFMFHRFFRFFPRYKQFLFSLSFNFTQWSTGRQSQLLSRFSFFVDNHYRFGLPAEIRWPACISKSQMSLCVSFFGTDFELCICHMFVWSNFNFLHNSQWITFPTHSYLFFYSFWANSLHSLFM